MKRAVLRVGSSTARTGDRGLIVRSKSLVVLILVVLAAIHQRIGDDAGVGTDLLLDHLGDLWMLLEEILGVLTPLADALAVIGEPRTRLLDHPGLFAEIDQLAGLAHALAI